MSERKARSNNVELRAVADDESDFDVLSKTLDRSRPCFEIQAHLYSQYSIVVLGCTRERNRTSGIPSSVLYVCIAACSAAGLRRMDAKCEWKEAMNDASYVQ